MKDISSYPPYIELIVVCLGTLIAVMFANEMNKYNFLDKDMQYSFYLNTIQEKEEILSLAPKG